jgi:hypothetical protein
MTARPAPVLPPFSLTSQVSGVLPLANGGSLGYIDGAKPTYNNYSQVGLEAGSAMVNGSLLTWNSPLTVSTSGIAALNYIYLYSNSGTATLEKSTTVPVWDSTLGYWKKTGDATRRCVFFVPKELNYNAWVCAKVAPRLWRMIFPGTNANSAGTQLEEDGMDTWSTVSLPNVLPATAIAAGVQGYLNNMTAAELGGAYCVAGFNPSSYTVNPDAGGTPFSVFDPAIPASGITAFLTQDVPLLAGSTLYVGTYPFSEVAGDVSGAGAVVSIVFEV